MTNIIEKMAYEAGKGKTQSEREKRIYDVLTNVLSFGSEIRIKLNGTTPVIRVAHSSRDGFFLQDLVWSESMGCVEEEDAQSVH